MEGTGGAFDDVNILVGSIAAGGTAGANALGTVVRTGLSRHLDRARSSGSDGSGKVENQAARRGRAEGLFSSAAIRSKLLVSTAAPTKTSNR